MGELKIGRMVLGVCQTNCYFLYREGAKEVIVIDPADYGSKIYESLVQKNGFRIMGILLTHGHFDHIWGCKELKAVANEAAAEQGMEGIKVYACQEERELLRNAHSNVSDQMGRPYTLDADVYLRDGESLTLGDISCTVIATPGHTAGGCCYYFKEADLVVCGDTIFAESVGRTDFPTGSMGTLVRSIKEKLMTLPGDTKLYPGHGESTTVEHERKYNPFL